MSTIWKEEGGSWKLAQSAGFPDEATLHGLIEENPQLLPLSGAPQLVVLGREVRLGAGYADLVAVDLDGSVVVIEVKLARNAEARRAVVGQVLSYAAHLQGLSYEVLEGDILRKHLARRGVDSLLAAVRAEDQTGSVDPEAFRAGVEASLSEGALRLVFVLDEAPEELSRIAGYLELVADRVTVDLITVSMYEVGGQRVIVPQRVDPGRAESAGTPRGGTARRQASRKGQVFEGSAEFRASFADADASDKVVLDELTSWAEHLHAEGLVRLQSFLGTADRSTLLPRIQPDNAGLVTIWHERGPAIQFWRSVFERKAPEFIEHVEELLGQRIGQGSTTREVPEGLLEVLGEAYRGAARGT